MNAMKEWMQFMEGIRIRMVEKVKWLLRTRNRKSFLTTEVLRYVSIACLACSMCRIEGATDFLMAGYAVAGFVLADACYYGAHPKRYAIRMASLAVLTEPFFDYMATGRFFCLQIQSPLFLALVALLPLRCLCRLQQRKGYFLYPYRGVFYYLTFSLLILCAVHLHIPYPAVAVSAMALPVFFRGYRNLVLIFFCLLAVVLGCRVAPWLVLSLYFYYDRKREKPMGKCGKWIPYGFYAAVLLMACLFQ